MSKKIIISTVLGALLFSSAIYEISEAKGHGNNHNYCAEMMKENMPELTAEQKAEIKKLADELEKSIDPLKVEIAQKRAAYRAIMKNDNPNPDEASKLAGEIEKLSQDIQGLSQDFHTKLQDDYGFPAKPYHMKGKDGKHGRNNGQGMHNRADCDSKNWMGKNQ